MSVQTWEYCLLTCTPIAGFDEEGYRVVYQLVSPDEVRDLETRTSAHSSLVAIGSLLNELGWEGWELVAYDTSTNRGVFKRPST